MTRGRPKKNIKIVPKTKQTAIIHQSGEEASDAEGHHDIFMVHDSLKTDFAREAEAMTDSEDEGLSEWEEDSEELTAVLREMEMRVEMEDGEWEDLTKDQRRNLKRKASRVLGKIILFFTINPKGSE